MNYHQEFVLARLEEQVLDVTEENVYDRTVLERLNEKSALNEPILWAPIEWYLIPFWCISTSPGSRLPSVAGLINTSGSLRGRRPFNSMRVSCSITSAISFFCCSRLLTSFFNSVICLYIVSNRCPSAERYVTERIKLASGSSKG